MGYAYEFYKKINLVPRKKVFVLIFLINIKLTSYKFTVRVASNYFQYTEQ